MECFKEALATLWIQSRAKMIGEPVDEAVFTAQDNLEQCKKSMEQRLQELQSTVLRLAKEAVLRKKQGDIIGARSKIAERARAVGRLNKLRGSLNMVDAQLDAIKSSELDKEIMLSLRASSHALKKAGIGVNVQEVENVMSELDNHMQEIQVMLVFTFFCQKLV